MPYSMPASSLEWCPFRQNAHCQTSRKKVQIQDGYGRNDEDHEKPRKERNPRVGKQKRDDDVFTGPGNGRLLDFVKKRKIGTKSLEKRSNIPTWKCT